MSDYNLTQAVGYGEKSDWVTLIPQTNAIQADISSDWQTNRVHDGVYVVVDISAIAGTPTANLVLESKDQSGSVLPLGSLAVAMATGPALYPIYPNSTGISLVPPRTWRVTLDVTGSAINNFDGRVIGAYV